MALQNNSRKIYNPFLGLPGYNCFGCNPDNPAGLRMTFVEEGDELVSSWDPKSHFQGYFGVLHGGVQAALMDEIASWVVYVKLKTAGFTSRAEIRYHKTVFVNKGLLTIRAKVQQMRRNLADIEVTLVDSEENRCASGVFTYFTFPVEKTTESMYYPAYDNFFEEEE
ncbi:MAG: PaaI family thioesterase [Bacteroidetes bacterium]|nr:MAG: PaaI family thioesterase [Bacteroidota bacterium]